MTTLLSVITVTRNNGLGLEKTLLSCGRFLSDPRVELVIVDGASSDDTGHRIERWRAGSTAKLLAVSEPDKGIYDAMNKGLRLASGRHVIFMNSGDVFHPDFRLDPDSLHADAVLYGGAEFQSNDGGFVKRYAINDTGSFLSHNTFCHQAIFYPRELLLTLGGYDLNYRVSADFDLTLKCFQRAPFAALNETVCVCELGGFSHVNGWRSYKDRMRSFRANHERRLWVALLAYAPVFFAKHLIVKALEGSRVLAWYRSARYG